MKSGMDIGKYKLIQKIGQGGNAYVWKASFNSELYALKVLKKGGRFSEKYKRFCEEIQVVSKNQDCQGIVPIFDSYLPKRMSKSDDAWYVMPIAQPIKKEMKRATPIRTIVACIKQLAEHLVILHERGIVHRDIKPSNLYKYKNNWCFGDFGLVDYPGKEDLTEAGGSLGAKWTIAPEMKRDAAHADGKKADVYSLAKTLWILLTGEGKGFDGQYDENNPYIRLRKYDNRRSDYLVDIEVLLRKSTDNDPNNRPTIMGFAEALNTWEENEADFQKSNLLEWNYVCNKLFTYTPQNCSWNKMDDIINVLNIISEIPSLNHMMLPDGGGLDLNEAILSQYQSNIELSCVGKTIIGCPRALSFENIDNSPNWSYFRLEFNNIQVSGVYNDSFQYCIEDVLELEVGKFVHPKCWTYNHYNDKPIPEASRLIARLLNGTVVIFSKASLYNGIPATYDGRHNNMDSNSFRGHVEKLKEKWEQYLAHKDEIEKERIRQEEQKNTLAKAYTQKLIGEEEKQEALFDLYLKNFRFDVEEHIIKKFDQIDSTRLYGINIYFKASFSFMIDNYRLKRDLYFRKSEESKSMGDIRYIADTQEDAVFSSMEVTEQVIEIVKKHIDNRLNIQGKVNYSIVSKRIYAPKHLFAKDELAEVILSGDDSHRNILVVNEDGLCELIDPTQYSYYKLGEHVKVIDNLLRWKGRQNAHKLEAEDGKIQKAI